MEQKRKGNGGPLVCCEVCPIPPQHINYVTRKWQKWRKTGERWFCRRNNFCVEAFKTAKYPDGNRIPSHKYEWTLADLYPPATANAAGLPSSGPAFKTGKDLEG